MSSDVDSWLMSAADQQRPQLVTLREIILSSHPGITESLKWKQPCYALNGLFCYLQRAKTHVTLGFQQGTLMDDPGKVLEGDGAQMRHITFPPGAGIDTDLCRALVREAIRVDAVR